MPFAGRLRCGGTALVGTALPRRLYLLWLARSPASRVLVVRPPAAAYRSTGQRLRPRAALRSRWPNPCPDRLLGQRHVSGRCAFLAPSSDVVHQRHLLPGGAERRRRLEVRGPAAVAPHGDAAATRRCA